MKRWYALHRWLGAIAMVQLALWTVSGLFFAVMPLDQVRGEDRRVELKAPPINWRGVKPLPHDARGRARQVNLSTLDGRAIYEVVDADGTRLFDAATGNELHIGQELAERLASADYRGEERPSSATLLTANPPLEYRGKPLPAWSIEIEDDRHTRIYVDASTGRVTARRNDTWRWFDFFWALHIMDYGEREDFNHPLLVVFASLSVVTVVSGAALWALRLRNRFRRKRKNA